VLVSPPKVSKSFPGGGLVKKRKVRDDRSNRTKREMKLWLQTFGGCHERLCDKLDFMFPQPVSQQIQKEATK
jgi:hypothetical protein